MNNYFTVTSLGKKKTGIWETVVYIVTATPTGSLCGV
jgi:hypothetical protein